MNSEFKLLLAKNRVRSFRAAATAVALGATIQLFPFTALADDDHHCLQSNLPSHVDCGTHNMMLVGTSSAYLSHLPMFDSEHRFQVIVEATFADGDKDVRQLYAEDRKAHPEIGMYTVNPRDAFVLSGLFAGETDPPRTGFVGTVHRGHFERGSEEIDGLQSIDVHVSRLIYARELQTDGEKSDDLRYILFGNREELFLAHEITASPDFDQIVSVDIGDRRFTADELRSGIIVTVPGRANTASTRLRTDESVEALAEISGDKPPKTLRLHVEAEPYFEEGELLANPSFHQTPLEEEAGF